MNKISDFFNHFWFILVLLYAIASISYEEAYWKTCEDMDKFWKNFFGDDDDL